MSEELEISPNRPAVVEYFLADEALTLKEWCGGAMIVAAGLLSERLGSPPPARS